MADIDNVDQATQAGRGVLAEANVHVDAAGTVCARPCLAYGPDHLLHHRDV